MIEQWLPAPGFEGLYEVSDIGRVRSVSRIVMQRARWSRKIEARRLQRKLMTPNDNGHGYLTVFLRKDGRSVRRYVHRLVCEAFSGPAPSEQHHAAHWDGDTANNAATNLRWATPGENARDRERHGTVYHRPTPEMCPKGHPYAGDNTRLDTNGHKICITCQRATTRRSCGPSRPAPSRRRPLPLAVREAVAVAASRRCAICGEGFAEYQIDHILAVFLGGGDEMTNLRALCIPCHKGVTKRQSKDFAKVKRIQRRGGMLRKKPSRHDLAVAKMLNLGGE